MLLGAIGTQRVTLLYAGSNDAFTPCSSVLKTLGENSRFAGTYVSAAHGAMLCEAEDVDLDLYANAFVPNDSALRIVQEQASDCGDSSEVPDFVAGTLDRVEIAGHGDKQSAGSAAGGPAKLAARITQFEESEDTAR